MSFHQLSLLTFTAALCVATTATAADPTPRLSALEAMGRQNMNSIQSDPRTGGPQGISLSELPAAAAYRQSQKVDALWAINAGSTAPLRQIQLAHPSHVPGVPGSRPFVSDGPISQTPGSNRRPETGTPAVYPQLTQSEPAAATTVSPRTTSPAMQAASILSSAF